MSTATAATAATQAVTFKSKLHFHRAEKGAIELRVEDRELVFQATTNSPAPAPKGRVPKISRLMALAIRFQGMLDRGEVKDYAELARLGHVSRARVTQIMNLLNLAPDLQEAILFLPAVEHGRDPVKEWQVRPVAAEAAWGRQREMWSERFQR
jgi:hypothetical protein